MTTKVNSSPSLSGIHVKSTFPTAEIAGAAFVMGGAVLTLLSFQVIPHSINAITRLGIYGQIIGIGAGGIGITAIGISRVKQSLKKEFLKGTVFIHCTNSGPIQGDRCFEFSKRLKNEKGEPILVEPEDLYLEFAGTFEKNENVWFLDRNGEPTSELFLPLSLFKNVKEGESIRFYFDNVLIELCCKQNAHPMGQQAALPFEEFLKTVQKSVQRERSQALWPEDVQQKPTFMGELVGNVTVLNGRDPSLQDFSLFEENQKNYGQYQKLEPVNKDARSICFPIHMRDGIDLNEVYLMDSRGLNGARHVWILIPHKQKNSSSGKYAQYLIPEQAIATLDYNNKGWLQLNLS